MRGVTIDRHGGPEVLTLTELPEPVPAAGQVLIRTVASSINPVDWKTRAGLLPTVPTPMVMGSDLAGIVVRGDGRYFAPGDRVITTWSQLTTGTGTWVGLFAVPADLVARAPESVSLTEAATLPLAGLTAVQALDRLGLVRGETLLVLGAAGAVGGLAVQLAVDAGMAVDGLVSREAQVPAVLGLGARSVTTRASGLHGYDAVLDTAGLPIPGAVRNGGRYVTIAQPTVPDQLAGRGVDAAVHYVRQSGTDLTRLVALVDAGRLRLRIAAHHPVREIVAASRAMEAGGLLGKVVLTF
ncbi:MAG: NADP-dependent oxidoreductase [Actinomycetales bacterium]|nr:NADP-dependent oxidoreductase [Actinomycetales bacterium]